MKLNNQVKKIQLEKLSLTKFKGTKPESTP